MKNVDDLDEKQIEKKLRLYRKAGCVVGRGVEVFEEDIFVSSKHMFLALIQVI